MLTVLLALTALAPHPPSVEADYDWACPPERHAVAAARLRAIRDEDQADRHGDPADDIIERDKARRREVAALFGEGCLRTAQDHHDAALVFQHGQVPDHYYQAYLFARRAVALGDEEASWLVPRAIDRYLLSSGYAQLFGSNFTCQQGEDGERSCCMEPAANGFTDEQRAAMGEPPLAEKLASFAERMGEAEGRVCEGDRPDPPRGLFPGVW